MSDLNEWNERFNNIDMFAKPGGNAFEFELGMAYPVRVTKAEVVKSKRGDVQIKLACLILENDSEDAATHARTIQFFTLPKQMRDIELNSFELVSKLTQRRTADVVRLLSAANRAKYGLYSEVRENENGKKVFLDFEGKAMNTQAFKLREAQIHEAVTAWVDAAHNNVGEPIEDLEETKLYIRKVENKKDRKYPYTNLFAIRPRDGKIFGEGGAE